MSTPICVVDAFTSHKFRGNPAAVCFLDHAESESWMQQVAAELNLSETAFLVPQNRAWLLRWFTPTTEVALCGHATLASAHALWESEKAAASDSITFQTLHSGQLICQRSQRGIEMDFPICPVAPCPPYQGLREALGCDINWSGRSEHDYLLEVANEAVVRGLKPDLRILAEMPIRGVIVTARSNDGYDFVSRFFAPAAGIAEDPVTGSAHCSLAPYWADRLGRLSLTGWQASSRGGEVHMEVRGNRVQLGGRAVTVWRGTLL